MLFKKMSDVYHFGHQNRAFCTIRTIWHLSLNAVHKPVEPWVPGGASVTDVLILEILRKALNGQESYSVKDRRISSLREFQFMVEAAKAAHDDGLVDAFFQSPSRGKLAGGLIRAFTLVAITPSGLQRLEELDRPARAGISPRDRIGCLPGFAAETSR